MTTKDGKFEYDLENDDVHSRAVITHQGKKLWPNPKPLPMLDTKKAKVEESKKNEVPEKSLYQ